MLRWIQGKTRKDRIRNEVQERCDGQQADHHVCRPETPFVVWPCYEKRRRECCKACNNDDGGREETSRKAQTEVDGPSAERSETTPGAKTIKKNTNSTQNKSQTHPAKQYKVTSFLSTDCELSTETCSKNVYSLGPSSIRSSHRTEKDGERQSWRSTPDRDKIGKGTQVCMILCINILHLTYCTKNIELKLPQQLLAINCNYYYNKNNVTASWQGTNTNCQQRRTRNLTHNRHDGRRMNKGGFRYLTTVRGRN